MELRTIAVVENKFDAKFGVPRQSGLCESVRSRVVFEPEYRNDDALRGIEGFSHLWLLWGFSEVRRDSWRPTVRPPRLGGNTRLGVFATRSPYRPNPIGLSCVKLLALERDRSRGTVLVVGGADLMNGTPIYDIKPYLPYADARPDAVGGFADSAGTYLLRVEFPEPLLAKLPEEDREAVLEVLSHDPRPSYQRDPERVYGLSYGGFDLRFTVQNDVLTVVDVTNGILFPES